MRSVLFITRKWSPTIGGMETYCVELTTELSRRTVLDVVALEGREDGRPPSFASLVAFTLRAILHYLKLNKPPDVVHIGDIAAWPLALVSRTKRSRPVIILSAHGTDVSYHRRGGLKGTAYRLYLRFGARLLRGARVIANSAATAEAAAETGWGVDTTIPLACRTRVGEPVGLDEGHLLFAGRLIEQKGCRWFVEEVLPGLPDAIGLKVAGYISHERERAVLRNPRVRFLGSLKAEQLHAAYRSALAVVVPNVELRSGEFEGFGLVAAEAAAAGGVVIAARTGGLVEAVIDGETGFLVPSGDPEAWRLKIAEISGWNEEQRVAFTARGKAKACEHYSWARVADDVMAVYSQAQTEAASR
jgi:glycosyltransferase involved in cell wall biosynthesis